MIPLIFCQFSIINLIENNEFTGFQEFSAPLTTGVGLGGDIYINTGSLTLTRGAVLNSNTFGRGKAGDIFINARDAVSFEGQTRNGLTGGVVALVLGNARGNGGDIHINADSLSLTNGAVLNVGTFSQGSAGDITINARDTVAFRRGGRAFSDVVEAATGQGGNIRIATGSLFITNGSGLISSTGGRGNAGSIIIDARDRVTFDGAGSREANAAFTSVTATGKGRSGDIQINTSSLSLTNHSLLQTATLGQGNAGEVIINARDSITFDQESGVLSTVEATGRGRGGNVLITTGSLALINGSAVAASTSGQGDTGSIFINARDQASFDSTSRNGNLSSGVFSTVERTGRGQGRNIQITTNSLTVTHGAQITARSAGQGNAGNIRISARDIRLDDGIITTQTTAQNGGNINLQNLDLLLLRHNSRMSTSAGISEATGNGGNIAIDASGRFIVAVPSENNDISANSFSGRGGRIAIEAQSIFGLKPLSLAEIQALQGNNDLTQFDARRLPTSDITAISQTAPALSGEISVISSHAK